MGLKRGDLRAEEIEPVDCEEGEQSTFLRDALDCCQRFGEAEGAQIVFIRSS